MQNINDTKFYEISIPSDLKLITNFFLQSIAEKMKRHILAITNIENSMDGEDTEEIQQLLQEQEHRATQRFENFDTFALGAKQYDICTLLINVENLTHLLSWNKSDGFHWSHIAQCYEHRSYRNCIS